MAFLLPCPNCGARSVYEFQFGGEVRDASGPFEPAALYMRTNSPGVQTEWWFHKAGCRLWFLAERNTTLNEVSKTWLPAPSVKGDSA